MWRLLLFIPHLFVSCCYVIVAFPEYLYLYVCRLICQLLYLPEILEQIGLSKQFRSRSHAAENNIDISIKGVWISRVNTVWINVLLTFVGKVLIIVPLSFYK